jgi:hypothetical protein
MYKIIGADQKEYGPITAEQLRQWISEGRINTHTKVQLEGSGVWKPASDFPEFATVLPAGAPPAVGAPISISMAPATLKTNQMAVWAMVTGIISLLCCQFLGPLSLILGIVALSQIKKDPQQTGSGFAIAGIVLGILSLIIFVVCIVLFLSFPGSFRNFPTSFGQ